MKHTVDYDTPQLDNIGDLNLNLDNLRLTGLAHIETLHQLLTKNRDLALKHGWAIDHMISQLEPMIETLRKGI